MAHAWRVVAGVQHTESSWYGTMYKCPRKTVCPDIRAVEIKNPVAPVSLRGRPNPTIAILFNAAPKTRGVFFGNGGSVYFYWLFHSLYQAGQSPDAATTGGNYATDVLATASKALATFSKA